MQTRQGQLLRIFIGEDDRHGHLPAYEWIVRQARDAGMAGATVLRGMEGFGTGSQLHKASILRLSTDLPVVIEIVDSEDKIAAFLPMVDVAVGNGIATLEKVQLLRIGSETGKGNP
jgi:PII-like signaling protein